MMYFVMLVSIGQGLGCLFQKAKSVRQAEALQAIQVGQETLPQKRLLDEVDAFLPLLKVNRLQDVGMAQLQGQSALPAQGLPGYLKVGRPPRQKFEAHIHPETPVLGQPHAAARFIPEMAQNYITPRHHITGFEGIGNSLIHSLPLP
jgi:hypothetical protein